jgi:hypothetical protein
VYVCVCVCVHVVRVCICVCVCLCVQLYQDMQVCGGILDMICDGQ